MSPPATARSGLSTFTAVARLALPKKLEIPKLIEVDVELFLGSPELGTLFGALRFYNAENVAFSDEPKLYFIEATFAQVPETDKDTGMAFKREDYDFIGDLQRAIPISPSLDDTAQGHRPSFHISGLATKCNKNTATFELNVDVWVSASKDIKLEGTKTPTKPLAPFLCVIPDSPKYKNSNKPTPYPNRFVTVHGQLTNILYKNGQAEQGIERFVVEVDQIVFLGAIAADADTGRMANKLDSPAGTPRGKGFGRFSKLGANSPMSASQASPSTPSPLKSLNKRARIDDEDIINSEEPVLSERQKEKRRAV